MSYGKGYDSDEGRGLAGAITSLMTGTAYEVSAEIASATGPFPGYHNSRCAGVEKPLAPDNVAPMLEVIERHLKACDEIDSTAPAAIRTAAVKSWEDALAKGRQHGYRNAQVTVLAPTGTIGFLMDCDTTGIEPDIALVKYKLLAGGGMLKIVNQTVPGALKELGYTAGADHGHRRLHRQERHHRRRAAPQGRARLRLRLRLPSRQGRALAPLPRPHQDDGRGAAVPLRRHLENGQPAQLRHGRGHHADLHRGVETRPQGRRHLSRRLQALRPAQRQKEQGHGHASKKAAAAAPVAIAPAKPIRRRMSDTRVSITHKFDIAGHEGYLTVGLFDDNKQPGELFITMAKEGSTIGGLMDTIGTLVSLSLQYGVPVEAHGQEIRPHRASSRAASPRTPTSAIAKSIPDYIFRWMGNQFIPGYREANNPERRPAGTPHEGNPARSKKKR